MKRPSDTSSPEAVEPPDDDPVFFVDRCFGRRKVPDALRAAGARVEVHDDHFAPGTADADWLPIVGELGWCVLTQDSRIRYHDLEYEAYLAAGVPVFVLGSGNLMGDEAGHVLVRHLKKMKNMARSTPRPFIASVTKSRVRLVERRKRKMSRRR